MRKDRQRFCSCFYMYIVKKFENQAIDSGLPFACISGNVLNISQNNKYNPSFEQGLLFYYAKLFL